MSKVNIFERLDEDNLIIYPINALKNQASSYTLAIFQPLEHVVANDNEVRNANFTSINEKYMKFFQKVNDDEIELVLSPEYSCPWSTIVEQLSNSFPQRGVLWVIGCESINISDLRQIIERYEEDITFIVEDLHELDSLGTKNFLDPIVYCFNAQEDSGGIKKVVVIQFKRRTMVDHSDQIERRHLIVGNDYYELMNDENSVRLITLICAEAIEYDLDLEPDRAYLIPHLQLNTNPFHSSFMDYRLDIFKNRKDIEIICVNWSKGFRINDSSPSPYGGSAYYMHADKINCSDVRINENHEKGVYYTFSSSQSYHRFLFNYNEYLFYLTTNQLLQTGSANIRQRRDGVESLDTFLWDGNWTTNILCDDNWSTCLANHGYLNRVSFLATNSAMAKERFLNLTSGNQLKSMKWYDPENLKSFYIDSEEKPSKLSVFLDPRNMEASKLNEYTRKVHWLKNKVLISDIDYPKKLSSLEGVNDFTVHEEASKSHLNVLNDEISATFIGLGHESNIVAERVYSNIADAIAEEERTLVVWYENDDGNIDMYYENNNDIDADFTESNKSITNDRDGE